MSGVDSRLVPTCARCEREVDSVGVEGGPEEYRVHYFCHGHVDVLVVDRLLALAMRPPHSDLQVTRAFIGGPGLPIDEYAAAGSE